MVAAVGGKEKVWDTERWKVRLQRDTTRLSDEYVHYLDGGDSFRGAHMSKLIKLYSLCTVYCTSYIFIKLLQKGL